MISSIENQTIALAGLFQSTELVQSIANTGQHNEHHLRVVLDSITQTNPDTVEAVYGGKANLKAGQLRLIDQLSGKNQKPDLQITQYTLALLKLENKYNSKSDVMQRISRGIESVQQLHTHYDTLDEEIISQLAKLYTDNISDLSPRIVVHGNREFLEQTSNANRIRACLLAGLRAAVLWRQCGGTRWKIVSARQRYVDEADSWSL